jgi:hypothetical protein
MRAQQSSASARSVVLDRSCSLAPSTTRCTTSARRDTRYLAAGALVDDPPSIEGASDAREVDFAAGAVSRT